MTPALLDGTAYLVPFVRGVAFIAAWGAQAIAAYRAAQRAQGASGPALPHSPAAAIAWLGVPLLVWGTVFWLASARNASPPAVLDGVLSRWETIAANPNVSHDIATDPGQLTRDVARAADRLVEICRQAQVAADCDGPVDGLLRDVRFRVVQQTDEAATAVLELVRYERRPTRFLGFVQGATVIAVPTEPLLRLELAALEGGRVLGWPLGDRRWQIVDSSVPSSMPRD